MMYNVYSGFFLPPITNVLVAEMLESWTLVVEVPGLSLSLIDFYVDCILIFIDRKYL